MRLNRFNRKKFVLDRAWIDSTKSPSHLVYVKTVDADEIKCVGVTASWYDAFSLLSEVRRNLRLYIENIWIEEAHENYLRSKDSFIR